MQWRGYYQYTPKLEINIGVQASVANELLLYNRHYEVEGEYALEQGIGLNSMKVE